MAWTGKRPSAFADTITESVGRKTRAAALQALTGVIERSPVDTGAFRGNNRVSVGSPDNAYDLSATDKSGGGALSAGSAIIAGTRGAPFTVIYVQNSLPYAQVLEDGSSKQAPQGMFAVTFNALVEASR